MSGLRAVTGLRALSPVLTMVVVLAACGHKGPPLPPLRPIPAAATGVSIERSGTAVTLRFTVPDTNIDGSTPPAADRVDIFALSKLADEPRPTPAELLAAANLVTSIVLRPADATVVATPDPRPAPGETASFIDTVAQPASSAAMVRYYAVVSTAGRRRGPLSPMLPVPLSTTPATPTGLKIDYDERTATAVWQSATARQRFVVEATDATGAHGKRLELMPIDAPTLELPVTFGQPLCLIVRSVDVREAVSVVGAATAPVCVTPVDHFPPPAPSGFFANAGAGGVDLTWSASIAPDLAGYIVLRGDNANGTLQRLTPTPVAGTTYRDQTARAGATYVYAVVAIDAATPPNQSPESGRQVVTARHFAPRVP